MSEAGDGGGSGASPRVALVDEQDRPVDADALARFAERALDAVGIPESHSLSVALVDRERIAGLKERYLGERRATDVLAFPMDPPEAPGPALLGDVVVCVEVAERQARALGRPLERELEELLVHGILHLAGHDHDRPEDEVAMAAAQRRVLRAARAVAR
jgi:probable rRNA maturation factor